MAIAVDNILLDTQTSDPGSPVEGQVWYNSTDKKLRHYVNGVVEETLFNSSAHKASVRITTTNSIANLSSASATISGVTCIAGDRVLVANGASRDGVEAVSNSHNGIYVFGTISGGNGPLTRTSDANTAKKLAGMSVFCQGCGTYHNLSLAESGITLETTLLNFNSVAAKANADASITIDSNGTRISDAVKPLLGVARSVRIATTANITLSGAQTIDGISAVAGDRVLAKNQTTGSQNGIYIVASGSWAYAGDWATNAVVAELLIRVSEGTANAHTSWRITNQGTITVGTTAITFSQDDDRTASGLRSATTIVAVSSATAPTNGQVLTATGSAAATWQTPGSISNNYKQSAFSEVSSDQTTTSTSFVDLTGASVTLTTGANNLIIMFSFSVSCSLAESTQTFQLLIDGSAVRGCAVYQAKFAGSKQWSGSIVYRKAGVTAASHTVKVQWKTSGGTASIAPVSTIAEHGSLLVEEVSV